MPSRARIANGRRSVRFFPERQTNDSQGLIRVRRGSSFAVRGGLGRAMSCATKCSSSEPMNLSESLLTPAQASQIAGSAKPTVPVSPQSAGPGSFASALASVAKSPFGDPRSVGPAKRMNPAPRNPNPQPVLNSGCGASTNSIVAALLSDPQFSLAFQKSSNQAGTSGGVWSIAAAGSAQPTSAARPSAVVATNSAAAWLPANLASDASAIQNFLNLAGSSSGTVGDVAATPGSNVPPPASALDSDGNFAGALAKLGADALAATAIHGSPISSGWMAALEELPVVGNILRLFAASDANAAKVASAQAAAAADNSSGSKVLSPSLADSAAPNIGGQANSAFAGTANDAAALNAALSARLAAAAPISRASVLPPIHAPALPTLAASSTKTALESAAHASNAYAPILAALANRESQTSSSAARIALTQTLSARWQSAFTNASSSDASNSGNADTSSQTSSRGNSNDAAFGKPATSQATPSAFAISSATDATPSGASAAPVSGVASNSMSGAIAGDSAAVASATNGTTKLGANSFSAVAQVSGDAQQAAQLASAMASAAQAHQNSVADANTSTTAQSPQSAQTPQLPQTPAALPGDGVSASSLFNRPDGSEMHLAMQTDLLGSIDLRATIHQSGLMATIGVQRAEVQSLLASELPALQHALAEKSLQVAQISVLNNSVTDGGSSRGESQSPYQHAAKNAHASTMPFMREVGAFSAVDAADSLGSISESYGGSYGRGQLNVLA